MTVAVTLEPPIRLRLWQRVAALLAVLVARLMVAATRGRLDRLEVVLRLLRLGAGPPPLAVAEHARRCVTTVSLRAASHTGCLARSLAVVVLCRSWGFSVTWKLGVMSPPPSSHAWVEAGGVAVGEPTNPADIYTPVLVVPARRAKARTS